MLLDVKNLQVAYGRIKALHGIDFNIREGEIVTIIGTNGAGKSSTLRAISRLVPSGEGTSMTFAGDDLLKYPPEKVVSVGLTEGSQPLVGIIQFLVRHGHPVRNSVHRHGHRAVSRHHVPKVG